MYVKVFNAENISKAVQMPGLKWQQTNEFFINSLPFLDSVPFFCTANV